MRIAVLVAGCERRKGILYSAFLTKEVHSKRPGVDHTVLAANNTKPAFPSWAFTRWHHQSNWGSRHPIAAYYLCRRREPRESRHNDNSWLMETMAIGDMWPGFQPLAIIIVLTGEIWFVRKHFSVYFSVVVRRSDARYPLHNHSLFSESMAMGEIVHTKHGGVPPPTSEIGCRLGIWGGEGR